MSADLLGRCCSRRRAVDHCCVAVDGGRLAGDRRRDLMYENEENRGSLVCGHVGVCVLQRVCVSVCAWRRPPAAPCTCG